MDAAANAAKQLRSALCRSFVNLCWPPAPKAKWPVPIPTRVMIELLLFGAAVGDLAVARQPVLALILGVAALTPRCSTPQGAPGERQTARSVAWCSTSMQYA